MVLYYHDLNYETSIADVLTFKAWACDESYEFGFVNDFLSDLYY